MRTTIDMYAMLSIAVRSTSFQKVHIVYSEDGILRDSNFEMQTQVNVLCEKWWQEVVRDNWLVSDTGASQNDVFSP